jgi:hypothetical protein
VVHFEQGIDMSLGGGQTETPVAGSNKYAQIMELMRRRNAMNNSTYTGGFNPYGSLASSTPQNTYDELARLQALADANRRGGPQGGSELGRGGLDGDGYGKNSSPLSSPMKGSFGYQALDTYGNILGGMLPFGLLAQAIAQSMNPSQVAEAGKLSAQAMQDAIAGYTSGEMFGAPPSDPSTFGGGGYGTPVADGGYGVTGVTGAGVAANPMGIDPATAQGQQSAAAAAQAASDAAIADAAEAEGVALGPAATGDVGGNDSVGGGFGGNDGSGAGFGGIYSRGGYVNKKHLKGPNPMGPDDGYGGLDDGEFVINAKSVGKYGIELMNAINAGKISKGKLRGLLEA